MITAIIAVGAPKKMKNKLLVLFSVGLLALLMADVVSAQSYNRVSEKTVRPVKGKTASSAALSMILCWPD
jgi:hypothetical protein